ncbi:MAG TPA: hypothetical protein VMT76_17685 [Puia sp.]|nr:hypothetical protein [Puia sp.]
MSENNDYTDGKNVGLHEPAHALTYVNFSVDDGRDDSFHNKFEGFSKATGQYLSACDRQTQYAERLCCN